MTTPVTMIEDTTASDEAGQLADAAVADSIGTDDLAAAAPTPPQVPAQAEWSARGTAPVRASGGLAERLAQLLEASTPAEPAVAAAPEPTVDPIDQLHAAVEHLGGTVREGSAASAERDDTIAQGMLDLVTQSDSVHAALATLTGDVGGVRATLGEVAAGLHAQLTDGLDAHGARVDGRLDEVRDRLAGEVGERTEQVHGHLSAVRDDLAATTAELAGVRALVSGNAAELSEDVATLTARVSGLDERLAAVDTELTALRTDLAEQLSGLIAGLGSSLEERLGTRIDEAVFAFASTILPVIAQRP